MSTCISPAGEYSDHVLDDAYTCTRCLVLDEDALVAELRQARARLAEVEAERDDAMAGVREWKHSSDVHLAAAEAWRPVVEAARRWRERLGPNREVMVYGMVMRERSRDLVAAVDALPPAGGTDA
jgi:hypothetical protein